MHKSPRLLRFQRTGLSFYNHYFFYNIKGLVGATFNDRSEMWGLMPTLTRISKDKLAIFNITAFYPVSSSKKEFWTIICQHNILVCFCFQKNEQPYNFLGMISKERLAVTRSLSSILRGWGGVGWGGDFRKT